MATAIAPRAGASQVRPAGPASPPFMRRVAWFFVLAYALSWAWEIPWAVSGRTVMQGQGWPSQLPALLGPLTAAVIVTAGTEGRQGIKGFAARLLRWRIGWRWWLVALSPLAFLAAAVGVVAATATVPSYRDFSSYSGVPAGLGIVGVAVVIVVVNGLGEEAGWRGYALEHLQRRWSPLRATLVIAPLWAAWHLPLFFSLDSYKDFSPAMIPVFFFGLVCGALVCTWIYNRTGGSILAVAVWHALYNVAGGTKAGGDGSGTIAAIVWTFVVVNSVLILVLELRARRRGLPSPLRMCASPRSGQRAASAVPHGRSGRGRADVEIEDGRGDVQRATRIGDVHDA